MKQTKTKENVEKKETTTRNESALQKHHALRLTGALNFYKFNEIDVEAKKAWVRNNAEKTLRTLVKYNDEEDEKVQEVRKHRVTIQYNLIDSFYETKGVVNAKGIFSHLEGLKLQLFEVKGL